MTTTRNPNLGIVASIIETDATGWQANLGRSTIDLSVPRNKSWWTGKAPIAGHCPGVKLDGTIESLDVLQLTGATRESFRDYFDNTWTLTEVLFSGLVGDEPFYRPPYHGLRHPLIFYYVHPAVLYVNKLRLAGLIDKPIDELFECLFETGVDEMSWDDMSKNEIAWPTIDEAHAYRKAVYETVSRIIQTHPLLDAESVTITQESPLWSLAMGFEHERIHLETSSVLIRELPAHLVKKPPQWPAVHRSAQVSNADHNAPHAAGNAPHAAGNAPHAAGNAPHAAGNAPHAAGNAPHAAGNDPHAAHGAPKNEFVTVEAGHVRLGKPYRFPTFGWDNEYGTRDDLVDRFKVTRNLISNGEYLEFLKNGGYHESRYWTNEGWRWRSFRNVKWPSFWVPDGPAGSHLYKLRTIFDIIPMPLSWPAVVNYHEAKAYANWKSERDGVEIPYRLLCESEHQRLRQLCGIDDFNPDSDAESIDFGVGTTDDSLTLPASYNLNLRHGSESPVDERSGLAVNDLFGNVWQWLEDHFNPLPGFKVHRYYDDFSTPCFDGEHQMIMGGSFVSTGDEATPWARFHFRPHFFQHAGFRLASSLENGGNPAVKLTDSEHQHNPYETEEMLSQYLTLHFGENAEQMPFQFGPQNAVGFPQRCADLVSDWAKKLSIDTKRALDIGCAVGGASFRLAETFDEVLAIDLSDQFISTARTIKQEGRLAYKIKEEGEILSEAQAVVDRDAARRVEFRRADASSLPPELMDYDAVLIANVLCRLPSPMACLSRMSGARAIVRRGGLLVLMTPFTWMEKFTPKEVWLGGYLDENGDAVWSEDGLKRVLAPDFELLERKDMPLIIREHRRKYQYIVSAATVWRRK